MYNNYRAEDRAMICKYAVENSSTYSYSGLAPDVKHGWRIVYLIILGMCIIVITAKFISDNLNFQTFSSNPPHIISTHISGFMVNQNNEGNEEQPWATL